MAEGFANHYGNDVVFAKSAGISPVTAIVRDTVEAMLEKNVDISKHIPSQYMPIAAPRYDIIVNMSGMRLPGKPPQDLIEWQIEDPYRQKMEVYRRVRDDLERRVMNLILKIRMQSAKG